DKHQSIRREEAPNGFNNFIWECFSATAACLNNLGPGLGEVAAHYGAISDTAKWLLTIAMVFGRLEIFTLLVLFTPTFWRG
ncbi:MAG: potassium transporter TrkG, partial [Pseudomonadota bacterium]